MREKKVYVSSSVVTSHEKNVFLKKIAEFVEQMQDKGCEIEIQYQYNEHVCSALILAYRMVLVLL